LSDRIVVFADGRPIAEMASVDASEERIMAAAVGTGNLVTAFASSAATTPVRAPRRVRTRPVLTRYLPSLLLAALVLGLAAATSIGTPYFLTPRNFASMAGQLAPLLAAALGQMAVILLGGIDLTVAPSSAW
jgi:predicted ABC-type sugar transport system permease subunit